MKRRAQSELIGWVLLIGLSITIAAFIVNWSINYIKSQKLVNLQDLYCEDVNLLVSGCLNDKRNLDLRVANNGLFIVRGLKIQYKTSIQDLTTTEIIGDKFVAIEPKNSSLVPFDLNLNQEQLKFLALIPYVFTENNESIICAKKIAEFTSDRDSWLNNPQQTCSKLTFGGVQKHGIQVGGTLIGNKSTLK